MGFTDKQLEVLAKPLNSSRVETRRQSGKDLSYLAAWDVKAHLIRVFGYGNFATHLIEFHHVTTRDYTNDQDKPMVEVVYSARVSLEIRDPEGNHVCSYTEGACGSASGPEGMLGDHHDNALKTAESDALKRCAINLGNQFGLSLYDNGSKLDVVKGTLLDAVKEPVPPTEQEKEAADRLAHSLGATEVPAEETP
jgi:recombination DNA repair RAD52 pathway protein